MKIRILIIITLLNLQNISSQCLFKEVTTLNATSLAIGIDNKLYGWGSTLNFDLNTSSGMQTNVTQIGIDENWAKIDGGNRHVLLLKSNGTLWAMGWNGEGQLGDNSLIDKNTPIQVGFDNDWVAISAGQSFSLALKNNGTLWAWGNNQNGQLGIGTTVNQIVPVQVGNDTNWSKINASKNNFALAIKNDGTLWAWGRNDYGYLGLGNYSTPNIPTQVGTNNNWLAVSSGLNHTLALKSDYTLWTWGRNAYGELGNNTTITSITPTQIGSENDWQFIDASYLSSKAIKFNGTLWCWGENSQGNLGDGTFINKLIPTQIGIDSNWSGILSGQGHTLALKTNSEIYSWGTNNFGQLANGNTINLLSPYQINCSNLGDRDFDVHNNSVKIIPNPITDTFEIATESDYSKVELYDLTGRMLKFWYDKEYQYSLNNIDNGVYTLLIYSSKRIIIIKVIKK